MNECTNENKTTNAKEALQNSPYYEKEKKEKCEIAYSPADIAFAWLSYLFGYLFCRAFPALINPLGAFLTITALFIATFVIFKIKKIKTNAISLAAGISAVVVCSAIIITGSEFLGSLAFLYALASYCYFVYASLDNSIEKGFSDLIFIDYFKAIFVMPFYSLTKIFRAASQGKAKHGMGFILKVLSGLLLTAIPTVIVLILLSYDEGFGQLIDKIFSFDMEEIFSHIGSLILAIPIGMYIFGLYASSTEKLVSKAITAEGCKKGFEKAKIMPQLTALTAVLPIVFLYVVYFISQWKYYVSGFTGILPEDFSYAEYARNGFFELCAVSVINLIIIITVVMFMRRGGKRTCPMLKIITTVFCISTLILIATAIAKLVMYIDCYGLTQKRVYAMWLMVVIAIVYIIVALGQYISRIKTVSTSLAVCIMLFAALALCNVNSIIAEYNVDRYIEGTLDTVDISAMDDLGDSAIPALVRLAEEFDARKTAGEFYHHDLCRRVEERLEEKADIFKCYDESIFAFNFPEHRAKVALRKYGLIEK